MILSVVVKACAVAASSLFGALAIAGGGHDHGEAKPTAAGPAPPRFTAQSDLFEAVGILLSDEFSVLIDRTASNEPVLNATVELSSGGITLVGKFHADHGDYSFDSKPFAKAGEYPIILTIRAGADSDLLTGDLDVRDASAASSAAAANEHAHAWERAALWGGGGVLLAAALFFALRRLIANRRNSRNNRHRLGVAA